MSLPDVRERAVEGTEVRTSGPDERVHFVNGCGLDRRHRRHVKFMPEFIAVAGKPLDFIGLFGLGDTAGDGREEVHTLIRECLTDRKRVGEHESAFDPVGRRDRRTESFPSGQAACTARTNEGEYS